MELQQIRYFLALAKELNFTRAAEVCGVSQPSLTRAIKRLEEELGGQLVRREGNRTHLSELGLRIKPRLQQALSLTEIAATEAHDFTQMNAASLSIGVMCTIGPARMIPLVNHIGTEHPQLTVKIRTGSGREILDWLLEGKIDVGIVSMADYPDELTAHELYQERYMIGFPANHRFAQMENIPLAQMKGEKYVLRLNCEYLDFLNSTLSSYEQNEMLMLQNSMKSMRVCHRSEHEEWIQAMVVAGMGCAVVPQYMSLNSELQMRPLVLPEVCRSISVVTVRGRPHTPTVSYFSNLCKRMDWGYNL